VQFLELGRDPDVLHVGSPEEAVDIDQVHYFTLDAAGSQINPNPLYGQPTLYQPGAALRLGMELRF
jgi:hypothetical protein